MPYSNPSEAYGQEITAADLHTGIAADPNAPVGPGPVSDPGEPVRPAGWVSPEAHEARERQIHRENILREEAEARQAAVEAEIDRRISQAREEHAEDVSEVESVEASE